METGVALEKDTENFIAACGDLHARLESGPLPAHDLDAIIFTASALLTELHG